MVDLRTHFPDGFKAGPVHQPAYESDNPRPAFMDELRSRGFLLNDRVNLPPSPEVGRVTRIKAPEDKAGKKSGWYIYNEFTDDYRPGAFIGVGVFGSWKSGERVVWSSKRKDSMSPAEVARLDEQIRAARIARDAEIARQQEEAAAKAVAIWMESEDATPDHPYLTKKNIEPYGIRVTTRGTLAVPMHDAAGKMTSMQFISLDEKLFLGGGKVKACFYVIDGEADANVYVCEGFATGATIHAATGARVYIAFTAGNLSDVASVARDQNQGVQVTIAGDDDQWTSNGAIVNPGRTKATEAAHVHRCRVIFPEFSDLASKPTDFNDMACLHGIDAVRELLLTKPQVYQEKHTYTAMPEAMLDPPGILGDVAAYYNATARAPQPGFAVQTALALASVILGRNFRSTKGNHTSLYFLNVGKSGTGKEHPKTVLEDILSAAAADTIVNGGGYTSQGAVFSTLLRMPRHITIIDEFGRYLEASRGQKNANLLEANTQLMEAIGRCHGENATAGIFNDDTHKREGRRIRQPRHH